MTRVTPGAIVTTPRAIWRGIAPLLGAGKAACTLRIRPRSPAGSVRDRWQAGFRADPDTPSLSAEAYLRAFEQLQSDRTEGDGSGESTGNGPDFT